MEVTEKRYTIMITFLSRIFKTIFVHFSYEKLYQNAINFLMFNKVIDLYVKINIYYK